MDSGGLVAGQEHRSYSTARRRTVNWPECIATGLLIALGFRHWSMASLVLFYTDLQSNNMRKGDSGTEMWWHSVCAYHLNFKEDFPVQLEWSAVPVQTGSASSA